MLETPLKALEEYEGQLSALGRKRQQDSDRLYQKGFQCLELAAEGHFEDRALMREACETLIEAIRHNRLDIRPYLALSYLFSLVEKFTEARDYLSVAEELEPQHPILNAWRQALKMAEDEIAAAQPDTPALVEAAEAGEDLSELYAKLKTYLVDLTRDLMQQPPPAPVLTKGGLRKLEAVAGEQEQTYLQLQQQLGSLADEYDVEELERLLKPLEISLKRYRQALGASHSFREIRELTSSLGQEARDLNGKIWELQDSEQVPTLMRTLESLMDHCDRLADQIDGLDQQGFNTASLEAEYNAVLADITTCQQTLDKTIENLNRSRRQRKADLPPEPSTSGVKALVVGLAATEYPQLADRLWHLLPLHPYEKAVLGLQSFSLRPDRSKLERIIQELLECLAHELPMHEQAEIYCLLAMVFYSCRKPLLALEYLAYAKQLSPQLPHAKSLEQLLKTFQSAKTIKAPLINGVRQLLTAPGLNLAQMAQQLRAILPEQGSGHGHSLLNEALDLLCDFCMRPDKGPLFQVTDRLLAALATRQDEAEAYTLLAAIFFAAQKAMMAREYLDYAAALDAELPALAHVRQRAADLAAVAAPAKAPAAPVTIATRKPAPKIIQQILAQPSLDLRRAAGLLKPLLPADSAEAALPALQAFCQQPGPAPLRQVSTALLAGLEANQAESVALLGLLVYACGKPLLMLECLDYAAALAPDSAYIQQLKTRFKRK